VNSNNFIGGEREAHGLLVDLAKKYMKGDSRAEIESYKKNAMITMGARLEGVGTFPFRPSPVCTLPIPPICPLPVVYSSCLASGGGPGGEEAKEVE
jgi:hypothetical protein